MKTLGWLRVFLTRQVIQSFAVRLSRRNCCFECDEVIVSRTCEASARIFLEQRDIEEEEGDTQPYWVWCARKSFERRRKEVKSNEYR